VRFARKQTRAKHYLRVGRIGATGNRSDNDGTVLQCKAMAIVFDFDTTGIWIECPSGHGSFGPATITFALCRDPRGLWLSKRLI